MHVYLLGEYEAVLGLKSFRLVKVAPFSTDPLLSRRTKNALLRGVPAAEISELWLQLL